MPGRNQRGQKCPLSLYTGTTDAGTQSANGTTAIHPYRKIPKAAHTPRQAVWWHLPQMSRITHQMSRIFLANVRQMSANTANDS